MFAEDGLKTGDHFNHGAIPEDGRRTILPMRARRKEDRLVPMKSPLNAAVRFHKSVVSACNLYQVRRHEMIRVPELPYSTVCDTAQGAAARPTPVRKEDGLPHDEYF